MNIPTNTPAKNPFTLPTPALQEAIADEWQVASKAGKKYTPENMPLTAIAYTAIDKIAPNKEAVVEALLVYIDSDTLTYRATASEHLAKEQDEKWGEVLRWCGARFDVSWQVTSGVMPVEQSPTLHKAISRYLMSLDEWQLSVFCVLASLFSSLVLAIAVCEGKLSADKAFLLSRLEEEAQAAQWGKDEQVEARAAKMKEEAVIAERFLHLLNQET